MFKRNISLKNSKLKQVLIKQQNKNMMAEPLFKTINKFSNRLQKIKISLKTIVNFIIYITWI